MDKKIKDFLANSKESKLVLNRAKDYEVVSQWITVRNPIKTILNFFIMQIFKFSPSQSLKRFVFRNFLGIKIGKGVSFSLVYLDPLLPEAISIEDNSALGWHVKLLCHSLTCGKRKFGKINIGKNVLVGAFSLIGPNVKIGDNSAIAMGSVVIHDVPSNEFWGGNPAKKIKSLNKLV